MYLIKYRLLVGPSQHYAPSATAGTTLIKEILTGGGSISSITSTRDGQTLTVEDLRQLADQEIGPPDRMHYPPLRETLLRFARRRRK